MRKRTRHEIRVKGFFRAQVLDKEGNICGDTGWRRNTVTDNGLNNACAGAAIKASGSYQVGYMAIGQGTDVIATDATDLTSRENSFVTVSPSTVAVGTARCTASFDGSANSDTITIGEIGLFKTNSAGSLIAGNVYTTSQMTADQTLNATYELRFS